MIAQAGLEEERIAAISRSNTESNIKVAKLQMFNEKIGKISGFLTVCKLYIRMRIREATIKEQI